MLALHRGRSLTLTSKNFMCKSQLIFTNFLLSAPLSGNSFCGLTRNTSTGTRNTLHAYLSNLSNWVYRYGTQPGKWTQILRQPDRLASEMPLPRFAHQVAYSPFTRSVFLHGGNAGNFNESNTKGAGVKGSKDADGDNMESEDGREVSVSTGVKERRLDDFWRMELKRSVGLLGCLFLLNVWLTMLFTADLGQRRSLDKPSSKFDANSKSSHPSYK